MKYSEFKEKMGNMGFQIKETEKQIVVFNTIGETAVLIPKYCTYSLDTRFTGYERLNEMDREYIFYNANALASTPIEEREEEKRYRLKLTVNVLSGGNLYLVKNIKKNYLRLGHSNFSSKYYQTYFTKSELKDIDETGFVREEVTE